MCSELVDSLCNTPFSDCEGMRKDIRLTHTHCKKVSHIQSKHSLLDLVVCGIVLGERLLNDFLHLVDGTVYEAVVETPKCYCKVVRIVSTHVELIIDKVKDVSLTVFTTRSTL